jgi:hypothetical protein
MGRRGEITAIIEETGGNFAVAQALARHKEDNHHTRHLEKADHVTRLNGRKQTLQKSLGKSQAGGNGC